MNKLPKISITSDKKQVSMLQVHGNRVVVVSSKNSGQIIECCDGLVTNDPDITLKVSVADCIPLAFYDPISNSIGLIHAGWRGLYGGIIKNAIEAMKNNFGTNPKNLFVEIGPHICPKHYEVKADVSSKFISYKNAIIEKEEKLYLDLSSVVLDQLSVYGVSKSNILVSDTCTFEDTSLASYRRGDRDKTNYFFLSLDI